MAIEKIRGYVTLSMLNKSLADVLCVGVTVMYDKVLHWDSKRFRQVNKEADISVEH